LDLEKWFVNAFLDTRQATLTKKCSKLITEKRLKLLDGYIGKPKPFLVIFRAQ